MAVSKASKVLCLVLILALCFTFVAPRPVAHAEALTVSAIAAILVIIAGATGVALSYDGASGQSVQSWMEGQIGQYSSVTGIPVVDLFVNLRQATYRSATRQLVLAAGAVQEAFDFFSSFASQEGLSETPKLVSSFTHGLPIVSYSGNFSTANKNTLSEALEYLRSYGFIPISLPVSFGSVRSELSLTSGNSWLLDLYDSDISFFHTSLSLPSTTEPLYICLSSRLSSYGTCPCIVKSGDLYLIRQTYPNAATLSIPYPTGSLPSGSVAPIPTYETGYGMGLTYGGADAGTLDDFLSTGLDGAGAGTLDVTTTTVPFDEPVPTVGPAGSTTWDDGSLGFWDGLTGSISAGLTAAGAQVRTWVNSITAPITQAVEAVQIWTASVFDTSAVAVTDFSIPNLKNFFPFCIPFDIYDMLHLFAATRAAPVIDWTFDFGAIGTYDLTIDLSAWDGAAQVLRTCELVAFGVGLALITRRLIGG